MKHPVRNLLLGLGLLSTLNLQPSICFAQGTAFTYQGRLHDGTGAANGMFDLRFTTYDSSDGPSVVAGPLTNSPVDVTNGLFTVLVDFGAGVFDGSDRWLEIAVRPGSSTGAFTTLLPRQPLTTTPYALRAASANSVAASNVTGVLAAAQVPNLDASKITGGVLGDARLPANVALLSADQTFSGFNILSNSAGRPELLFRGNSNLRLLALDNGNYIQSGSALTSGSTDDLYFTGLYGTPVQMVVKGSGNVGIGTASPKGALHIASGGVAVTGASSPYTGAGPGVFMENSAPGGFLFAYDYTTMQPRPLLLNSPGGNVGIGTASPASTLDVVGNIRASSNLTAGSFTGPGTLRWQVAAGASVQAAVNTGYIATNDAGTVITLPAAPTVGDVVRVSGAAGGCWRIAQKAGQSVRVSKLGSIPATWTPRGAVHSWTSIASSADGSRIMAAYRSDDGFVNGYVVGSEDSGVTWTEKLSLGSSGDSILVAISDGGNILFSTGPLKRLYVSKDSGATWLYNATLTSSATCASMSSDGTCLVASPMATQIYSSTNTGATWAPRGSSVANALAVSADGSFMAACSSQVLTSTNRGMDWTVRTNLAARAVACSADGSRLILVPTAAGRPVLTSSVE